MKIDISEKTSVQRAKHEASFHGETWYSCPYFGCGYSFEFFDAVFERNGLKKKSSEPGGMGGYFECPQCGRVFLVEREFAQNTSFVRGNPKFIFFGGFTNG